MSVKLPRIVPQCVTRLFFFISWVSSKQLLFSLERNLFNFFKHVKLCLLNLTKLFPHASTHVAIRKQIPEAKFMGPTWGPPGPCRPQMGPMLAPWTLLSGMLCFASCRLVPTKEDRGSMSFNSSVLSAASVNWAALVQIKAYRLLGAKPLPEPVLTNYHLDS